MWIELACAQLAMSLIGMVIHACSLWVVLGWRSGYYTPRDYRGRSYGTPMLKVERLHRNAHGVVEEEDDDDTMSHRPLVTAYVRTYFKNEPVRVGLIMGFLWPLLLPSIMQVVFTSIANGFMDDERMPLTRSDLVIHDDNVDAMIRLQLFDRHGGLRPIYQDTSKRSRYEPL